MVPESFSPLVSLVEFVAISWELNGHEFEPGNGRKSSHESHEFHEVGEEDKGLSGFRILFPLGEFGGIRGYLLGAERPRT